MTRRPTRMMCALLAAAWLAGPADAITSETRVSPLHVVDDLDTGERLLDLDPSRAEALAHLDAVRLTDVPWLTGEMLSLDLKRVRVLRPDTVFRLDGEEAPTGEVVPGLTLWSGRVAGTDDSDVYLAFSPRGSRGWIRRGAETAHLLAASPATGGGNARLVAGTRLDAQGWSPTLSCGVGTMPGTPGVFAPPTRPGPDVQAGPGVQEGTQAHLPILECRIAIETDTQYMQHFGGSFPAAADYLVQLVGAATARYREQIGIVFTITYGVFYLGPDPWTSQETGGDGYDLIFEFIDAWEAGQAPAAADVHFFMSGTSIVPSIGAFEGICSPDWAFAIGTGMNGSTPFPVAQGPLTWNFVVLAHELGHVFGADHTHAYCPPIDQCSSSFGACQTQQVCQTDGTLMSYCHQCPGGASNYTTYFHPFIVDVIRDFTEELTCLQPFLGVFPEDLGSALAGGSGTPHLELDFDDAAHQLLMEFSDAPASAPGAIVAATSTLNAPFKGGVFVPFPQWLFDIFTPPTNDYTFTGSVPQALAIPGGVDLYMQVWFVDAGGPAGLSSTNGVRFELVLPAAPPAPVWIAHPTNGLEYALSNVGTYASARAQAQSLGGDLASIDSQALNDWVVATFADPTRRSVYIGLTDATTEGSFTWEDGSPSGFTAWAIPQPNDDSASGQDYVELLLRADVLERELNDPPIAAGEWNDALGSGWFTNRGLMARPISP